MRLEQRTTESRPSVVEGVPEPVRKREPTPEVREPGDSIARRAMIVTATAVGVVVLALALWKLRLIVALVFVAITWAAAMRPGVDWLERRRIPRAAGVLLHYFVLLGLVALFLAFVVPQLVHEVQAALGPTPTPKPQHEGVKQQVLDAIQRRLRHLPSVGKLVHPALSAGEEALKVVVGIFFTLATAAYWVFERDGFIDFVTSFIARPKRKKVRDTWLLIDLKLGAFVRGQLLLIGIVGTVVSTAFFIIGEPYWLLIGIAVALLEIVPVVGPLAALILAVGAGLTASWHTAAFAGGALLVVRVLQDYIVNPRVLGGAVGLSPLLVLVAVSVVGVVLGPFYVLISVPLASLVVTLMDVVVRDVDPAEADVPTVIFPAKETET
jgi:predicted PurR-regulated permease PerM